MRRGHIHWLLASRCWAFAMFCGKGGIFALVSRQTRRNTVATQIVMPNDL